MKFLKHIGGILRTRKLIGKEKQLKDFSTQLNFQTVSHNVCRHVIWLMKFIER